MNSLGKKPCLPNLVYFLVYDQALKYKAFILEHNPVVESTVCLCNIFCRNTCQQELLARRLRGKELSKFTENTQSLFNSDLYWSERKMRQLYYY